MSTLIMTIDSDSDVGGPDVSTNTNVSK